MLNLLLFTALSNDIWTHIAACLFRTTNREESKNDRCNGDCKNLECRHSNHNIARTATDNETIRSSDNNNTNSVCSLRSTTTNEGATCEDASNNQVSIDSRTKGVCSAPQTHSGPTGPPPSTEGFDKDSESCKTVSKDSDVDKGTSTTTTCPTESSSSTPSHNNSSVSSSSCSNKATIQRQKRLRTPIWARSMSTNKTYIN